MNYQQRYARAWLIFYSTFLAFFCACWVALCRRWMHNPWVAALVFSCFGMWFVAQWQMAKRFPAIHPGNPNRYL